MVVTNLDPSRTSPSFDLVMRYDDIWTTSAMTSQVVAWLPSVDPRATREHTFTLGVPANALCSEPLGTTDVTFTADGNDETIEDWNRSNNEIHIAVNADYWRPDYVLREVGLIGTTTAATRDLSFAVRNIGPSDGGGGNSIVRSTARVSTIGGAEVFSGNVYNLAPGAHERDASIYAVMLEKIIHSKVLCWPGFMM